MEPGSAAIPAAVVGLGAMGSFYADRIAAGDVPGLALAAVCDIDAGRCARWPATRAFNDADALVASGAARAVIVATPHYAHTTIGIAALRAGLHLLVDKPISVHKADAVRLCAAHDGRSVFAAMFNQRADPRHAALKALLDDGDLGPLQRISWTITDWFRTNAYYASGGWRATWAGEGGGVLLNQCPHQLDLWQWLFGMPTRVRAWCRLGRRHPIEVEDEVCAVLDYGDGPLGVFQAGTGEAPGVNRLEIAGDNGLAVLEGGTLRFERNAVPASRFLRESAESFAKPAVEVVEQRFDDAGPQHTGVLRDFAAAIRDGRPVATPGAEGVASVELANAMLLSSAKGVAVDLPMDADEYEQWLDRMRGRG